MTVERTNLVLGKTISRLLKGGWHLAGGHGAVDPARAIEDMAAFVEAGISTFDCADHYTGVEAMIGDFRAAYPELAKQLQIHTKFVPDHDRLGSVDRTYVEGIIDRSRQRLGVDCLDLVQYYWWDTSVPGYVETAQMLKDLRATGKIAEIGVTNFDVGRLQRLLDAGIPIAANQIQYSPIDMRPENGMVALCLKHDIKLLCYGTVAGGFFSANWLNQPEPVGPFDNRSLTKYKLIIEDFGGWSLFQELLAALARIGDRHGATIGQIAVRWILDRPGVAGAIVGATSTRHLPENLAIAALRLTAEDGAEIAAITDRRAGPVGDCYDLERDKTGRHGAIMRYNQNEGRV